MISVKSYCILVKRFDVDSRVDVRRADQRGNFVKLRLLSNQRVCHLLKMKLYGREAADQWRRHQGII